MSEQPLPDQPPPDQALQGEINKRFSLNWLIQGAAQKVIADVWSRVEARLKAETPGA